MINKDYIIYTHVDSEIKTVGEFTDPAGVTIAKDIPLMDFCLYEGDTGKRNVDRIWESYNEDERNDNEADYLSGNWGDLLFKRNTSVLLLKDKLFREILGTVGVNQEIPETNVTTFLGRMLSQLMKDPNYSPVKIEDHIRLEFPDISVWLWSRALSDENTGELKGKIIDITPFVSSMTTSVGPNGGTFQIEMMPTGNADMEDTDANQTYYLNTIKRDELRRNVGELYRIINPNDVLFIRFESLKLETKSRGKKRSILKSDLPNQIYDMIGLVDSVNESVNPTQNDINISVTGRDLMKLLIEDGNYFYVYMFAQNFFTNIQDNEKVYQRNVISADYSNLLIAKRYESISVVIRFIINHLSNIGIVPDTLFSEYKDKRGNDRRTYVYRLSTDSPSETISPAPVTPPTSSNAVPDWGKPWEDYLSTEEFNKELQDAETFPYTEKPASGLWQIIKLAIDNSVAYRRIKDSSISQPDGSLINQFNKICQTPFVEFYGDTYGDLYYFIVRQPPYTKDAIRAYLREKNEDGESIIIDITEDDIFQDNLSFDDQQIYSWYELHPQGNFIAQSAQVTLAYIPAVFFPMYANIWGNKRLSVNTNYIPYNGVVGSAGGVDWSSSINAALNDLKFLIDAHCYLPFTRSGTISMIGDRRIKRGTFVRYIPTGEIFYVDGVSNSFSIQNKTIQRSTNLQVSRGMVEKYINHSKFNYFNIIDTQYVIQTISDKINEKPGPLTIRENYGVNEEVFNFFFKRYQFTEVEESQRMYKFLKDIGRI